MSASSIAGGGFDFARQRSGAIGLDRPAVERLITITGVNVIVATGQVAAIGDIQRLLCRTSSSASLASIRGFGSWALALRSTAVSARWLAARAMLVETA